MARGLRYPSTSGFRPPNGTRAYLWRPDPWCPERRRPRARRGGFPVSPPSPPLSAGGGVSLRSAFPWRRTAASFRPLAGASTRALRWPGLSAAKPGFSSLPGFADASPVMDHTGTSARATAHRSALTRSSAITASAARMPLRQAPWAVEKSFTMLASPAKNTRPSTGAASVSRAPACPGSAWE